MDDKPFVLNVHDLSSGAWGKLMEHFKDRLAHLRAQNDANIGEIETAELRGRIKEIKRLMDLDDPK
jgi:hypothetical protein